MCIYICVYIILCGLCMHRYSNPRTHIHAHIHIHIYIYTYNVHIYIYTSPGICRTYTDNTQPKYNTYIYIYNMCTVYALYIIIYIHYIYIYLCTIYTAYLRNICIYIIYIYRYTHAYTPVEIYSDSNLKLARYTLRIAICPSIDIIDVLSPLVA